jgi:hypothetical protein
MAASRDRLAQDESHVLQAFPPHPLLADGRGKRDTTGAFWTKTHRPTNMPQANSRVEPAALSAANEEPHVMNAPVSTGERVPPSPRKLRLRDFSERMAPERHRWIERNAYFYEDDYRYMRFLVPEGSRVLDLGCGIGDLLAALKPSIGVGVDFSPAMLEQARARHPHLRFVLGDVEDPSVIPTRSARWMTVRQRSRRCIPCAIGKRG